MTRLVKWGSRCGGSTTSPPDWSPPAAGLQRLHRRSDGHGLRHGRRPSSISAASTATSPADPTGSTVARSNVGRRGHRRGRDLPEACIAQHPAEPQDLARLLVDTPTGPEHRQAELAELPTGDRSSSTPRGAATACASEAHGERSRCCCSSSAPATWEALALLGGYPARCRPPPGPAHGHGRRDVTACAGSSCTPARHDCRHRGRGDATLPKNEPLVDQAYQTVY